MDEDCDDQILKRVQDDGWFAMLRGMATKSRLTKQKIASIQHMVLDWYAANKRELPWRPPVGGQAGLPDPYHILVSEIMLQQTQVPRVIPKYEAFLAQFPTIQSLATASRAAVITTWQGLGYNRRALNLKRAAEVVVAEHGGQLPSDLDALRSLPGIGRYTAGAIRNFAFELDTPAVDTNVKRFIDHFVLYKPKISPLRASGLVEPEANLPLQKRGTPPFRKGRLGGISGNRSENEYYDLAEQLMPAGKAHEWLHAVMDYTAAQLRQQTLGSTRRVEPRKIEQFIGSNRYLRGRTIDRLRHSPATLTQLQATIVEPIDVEVDRFAALVAQLAQEGFIQETSKGTYRLHE